MQQACPRDDGERRRGGRGGGEKSPVRTCIVTRGEHPPEDLIRFVAGPDGSVVPDLARRLPGRGVWVLADAANVAEAVRRKAFSRSLRRPAVAAPDLAERVEALLVRRAMDALSIANKTGAVATGFENVSRRLETGSVLCLVHGSDAAPDGATKLDRKYHAISRDLEQVAVVLAPLTIDQLSLALGRPTVVHVCLGDSVAAQTFVQSAGRLVRFRAGTIPVASASSGGQAGAATTDSTRDEPAATQRDADERVTEAMPGAVAGPLSTGAQAADQHAPVLPRPGVATPPDTTRSTGGQDGDGRRLDSGTDQGRETGQE